MKHSKLTLTILLLLIMANIFYGQELTTLQKTIIDATTSIKADYHVVFIETKDTSKEAGYHAIVKVYIKNKLKGTFKGSTFPNPAPTPNRPKDWEYSIVMSKEDMSRSISENRYYHWKRDLRPNGDDRLAFNNLKEIPTINLSSERYEEDMDSLDKFQYKLIYELLNKQGIPSFTFPYHYATKILVHKGSNDHHKGSAGCLTIHPDDEKKFFELIPMDTMGTCEVIR